MPSTRRTQADRSRAAALGRKSGLARRQRAGDSSWRTNLATTAATPAKPAASSTNTARQPSVSAIRPDSHWPVISPQMVATE